MLNRVHSGARPSRVCLKAILKERTVLPVASAPQEEQVEALPLTFYHTWNPSPV